MAEYEKDYFSKKSGSSSDDDQKSETPVRKQKPTDPSEKVEPKRSNETPRPKKKGGVARSQLERLVAAKRDGQKIIAVIGFGNSGKTFYINRLRHNLPDYDRWHCQQDPQKTIGLSPEGVYETHITKSGRFGASYLIADVSGESFLRGFKTQVENLSRSEKIPINDIYTAVIALADAFMLFIPAEDLEPDYADDQARATENKRMIESFHRIISIIKLAQKRAVDLDSIWDFLDDGITGEDINRAFMDHDQVTTKPLCILYTQADKLEEMTGDDSYDLDPFLETFKCRSNLANSINRFFEFYRFDFLSAFVGQEGMEPDYNLPCIGGLESFYWIHDYLRTQNGAVGKAIRFYKGYLPTRKAIFWRRIFDRNFRSQWKTLRV